MLIYEVGGSIRDELLGLPEQDRDWVVVGTTEKTLLDKNFTQVGQYFPVFLHPITKEEYALARLERKTGVGYTGFEVEATADVTLEEDLKRRDLTINAIARDESGQLIDPYGGEKDLNNRILKHVSDAFVEDPLRVFRAARFLARFAHLGFHIAPKTISMMQDIVKRGELSTLSPERVWEETMRALQTPSPMSYFRTLQQIGGLDHWFAELASMQNKAQVLKWHPESDCAVHTLMVLEQACKLNTDPLVRFCALVHDLGKGNTEAAKLPRHIGHEHRGVPLVEAMGRRIKAPKNYIKSGQMVARLHGDVHKAFELRPTTYLKILEQCDAFRQPNNFEVLMLCCEADARGRKWKTSKPYEQSIRFRTVFEALQKLDFTEEIANNEGAQIAKAIKQKRLQKIEDLINNVV